MQRRHLILGSAAALGATAAPAVRRAAAAQPTTIQWWHAMGNVNGERINKIVADFNASQDVVKVEAVYKGTYPETMTAAIAAFRAGQQPHIVQVFEVGTATMMAAKGAIYPVGDLMQASGLPFDPNGFLAPVKSYYTTSDGAMLSMPFNSSTPVLWVNRTALAKAGLDPAAPPSTWPEFETAAKKLQAAGIPSGLTVGWPSWTQIETFSAWHNVPMGTKENGFGGLDTAFVFNRDPVLRHVGKLAEWQANKIFAYGGRQSNAAPLFYNQQAALYIDSSANYGDMTRNVKDFEYVSARLPYWPDVPGAPQNSIIGGASLWVLKGHKDEEYKAVARFFNYISSPEVQAWWHQQTGYLPITFAAYELSKKQGFYKTNPSAETGILQMTAKAPTVNSKGIRFGNMVQIRDVIDGELEATFNGQKTAKQALDSAVQRGNVLLRTFEKQNG